MSVSTILFLTLAAIIISILVGYKRNINIGMIAIFFTYILGVFVLGKGAFAVIGWWPTSTFFQMAMVLAFYGFAKSNGALQVLTQHVLYPFRKKPTILPFIMYLVILVLGAVAGPLSVNSFMPVLSFSIAAQTGWNPVLFSIMCCIGAAIGSSVPFSEMGTYVIGGLTGAGYSPEQAESITWGVAACAWIVSILFILILYFITKANKAGEVQMDPPPKANPEQAKTLTIIGLVIFFMVVPSVLKVIFPGTAVAAFAGKMNLPFICATGFVLCALLKLGSTREVLSKKVPWDMIVMLCGISMLVAVATNSGAAAYLGGLIGENVPKLLIGPMLTLIAAGLSFFVPFFGTFPMLYPLLPPIVEHTGLSIVILAACIFIGGVSTSISPFSSGGAFIIAQCDDEQLKDKLFTQHIYYAIGSMIFCCILSVIVSLFM